MRTSIAAAALSAFFLTGCAGGGNGSIGSLNPFGWFRTQPQNRTLAPQNPSELRADPRRLIERLSNVRTERAPGGVILRATGLPPTQGYWNGELIPENGEQPVNGVLVYRFVIAPPPGFEPVSTPRSREVIVARFISAKKLESVSRIMVLSAGNRMTSRR